jgi:hypothetical protein
MCKCAKPCSPNLRFQHNLDHPLALPTQLSWESLHTALLPKSARPCAILPSSLHTCIQALSASFKGSRHVAAARPAICACTVSSCIHSTAVEMNERKSWLGPARGTAAIDAAVLLLTTMRSTEIAHILAWR